MLPARPVTSSRRDRPARSAFSAAVCPRPCSTPSPPTRWPRSAAALAQPGGRRGATRCRRSSPAGPGSSTAGRASASSPATPSRRTRASGSATTAASTGCARRAGAARATCAGSTRPTGASSARSTACAQRGRRDRRGRRGGALRRVPPPARPGLGPASIARRPRGRPVMKRALITGITGQDGRYLAEFLAGKGYQVFGLIRGQANPKAAAGPRREPGARARRRRPARPVVAHRGGRAGPAGRGLQPRRDQLRAALVQAGRAHRGDHRPRRAAHARGGAHRRRRREQPDPLLPGVVVGDVRQGARDAADRAHAVPPALAVRRRQGVRPRHDRELPRGVRPPRVSRASSSTTSRERRGLEFVTRKITNSLARIKLGLQDAHHASATSTPRATGATPATTSRRCG